MGPSINPETARTPGRFVLLVTGLVLGAVALAVGWASRPLPQTAAARAAAGPAGLGPVPENLAWEPPATPAVRSPVEPELIRIRLLDAVSGEVLTDGTLELGGLEAQERVPRASSSTAVHLLRAAAFDRLLVARSPGHVPREVLLSADVRELDVPLARAGRLMIRALDNRREPWAGAEISVGLESGVAGMESADPDWPFLVPGQPALPWPRTDATGHFLAADLPCEASLVVQARAAGREVAARARIPGDQRYLALDLILEASHCIRGRIVGPDGQPLRGVRVRAFDGGPARDVPDRTRPDGSFELCGLTRGDHRWRIEVAGMDSRRTRIEDADVDVGVIALSERHELLVRLVPGGPGQRCSPATLRVTAYVDGREAQSAPFHRDGTARLELPAGSADLLVTAAGALLVRAKAQVPCDPIQIHLGSAAAALRLVDADPALTSVRLLPVDLALRGPERVPPSGRTYPLRLLPRYFEREGTDWVLAPVPAGEFEVFVEIGQSAPFRAGRVRLSADELACVPASAPIERSLRGRVLDPSGGPRPGVAVAVALAGVAGQRATTVSDAHGAFAFPRRTAGDWIVFPADTSPWSEHARRVEVRERDPAPIDLVLPEPGALTVLVVSEEPTGAGCDVHLLLAGEGHDALPQSRTTDPAGRATFAAVTPGTYDVYARARSSGRDLEAVERRRVTIGAGQQVELHLGADAGVRRLRFVRRGSPVTDLEPGLMLVTPDSWSPAARDPQGSDAYLVRVEGGPTAFLLGAPTDMSVFEPGRVTQVLTLGYVPDLCAERAGTIDISGTDVVVVAGEGRAALPSMRLVALGPFAGITGFGDWCLAYRDEGAGVRRFLDVPPGAVVELAAGPPGITLERCVLTVSAGAEQRVPWPASGLEERR